MAVKGTTEKEFVTKQILENFTGSFVYGKEIRIPVNDVQIKVSLTCAKDNVDAGGDTVLPGAIVSTSSDTFDFSGNVESKQTIEVTEEEKQNIQKLMSVYNL